MLSAVSMACLALHEGCSPLRYMIRHLSSLHKDALVPTGRNNKQHERHRTQLMRRLQLLP